MAILELHSTCCQPGEIQTLSACFGDVAQGTFHQTIHAAFAFVFAIGEHHEATVQLRRRLHVTAIKRPGEGILHEVHAHPIEVLHDQGVVRIPNLGQQLLGSEGGHDGQDGVLSALATCRAASVSPISAAERWHTGGLHSASMAGLPDFNSSEEKRARFGKVFAPRVEKLIEDLQAVAKTANLEIYEFDDVLVKKLFVELARRFRATAHRFGIEFEITVEGESVE